MYESGEAILAVVSVPAGARVGLDNDGIRCSWPVGIPMFGSGKRAQSFLDLVEVARLPPLPPVVVSGRLVHIFVPGGTGKTSTERPSVVSGGERERRPEL